MFFCCFTTWPTGIEYDNRWNNYHWLLPCVPNASGGELASMICNLQQNPSKRPIVASWLPALLRQGCMYIIHLHGDQSTMCEERWMLEEDWQGKKNENMFEKIRNNHSHSHIHTDTIFFYQTFCLNWNQRRIGTTRDMWPSAVCLSTYVTRSGTSSIDGHSPVQRAFGSFRTMPSLGIHSTIYGEKKISRQRRELALCVDCFFKCFVFCSLRMFSAGVVYVTYFLRYVERCYIYISLCMYGRVYVVIVSIFTKYNYFLILILYI